VSGRLALLLLAAACTGTPAGPGGDSGVGDDGGATDTAGGPDGGGDSGGDTGGGPDLQVDVLIIGAGPAGLSAAWEASRAGASVLVVDREDAPGGAGYYARHLIAAGTRYQVDQGIHDTPDQMLLEWSGFTGGGDPEDPWVQKLAFESAPTLDWLIDELGDQFEVLLNDTGAGPTMRLHSVGYGELGPVAPLVDAVGDLVWTRTEATALRVDPAEPDRVAGAFVQDLQTGETLEIAATTTVVATGGFARDPDRVLAVRPELAGLSLVFEAALSSDGGGHPLLEGLGVPLENLEHHGVYVHSLADPRPGMEGEAVIMDHLEASVIVDADGQRVASESGIFSFTLVDALLAAPGRRLWAVMSEPEYDLTRPMPFGTMVGVGDPSAELTRDDLEAAGVVQREPDVESAAAAVGIDPTGLRATLERYEDFVATGIDLDFGKDASFLRPVIGNRLVVMELSPGSAKSFGGAWLDTQARVLDVNGRPIPGLYAAGEVAGMLGTSAVGGGFEGSVMACYLTGRTAGRDAAAEALGTDAP